MQASFIKSFIIGSTILFFTLGGMIIFDISSGNIDSISFIHTAFASGGNSSGGNSSGGSSYSSSSNTIPVQNSSSSHTQTSTSTVRETTPPNNTSAPLADTTAPTIFISYPSTTSSYQFESETGEFVLIGTITDNVDPQPKLTISYEGKNYSQFQSFIAPEGTSLLTIRAEDSSKNISEKIIRIQRTKPIKPVISTVQPGVSQYSDTNLEWADTTLKNQFVLPAETDLLDSDGDGLSDELEKKIGTHSKKADTDFDGISDGEEVSKFLNPLGKGSLFKDLQFNNKKLASEEAVHFLLQQGAIRANTQGLFYPEKAMNRAEALKLLTTVLYTKESSETSSSLPFQDISSEDWFYPCVQKAVAAGIISTNKNQFDGYKKLNRVEAMKMIFSAFEFPVGHIPPRTLAYGDIDITEWYSPYVAFATQNDIPLSNWKPSFFPGREISRGEFVEILYKTLQLAQSGNFEMFDAMPEGEWITLLEQKKQKEIAAIKAAQAQIIASKPVQKTPKPIAAKTPSQNNQTAQIKTQQDAAAKAAAAKAAQEAAARAAAETAAKQAAQAAAAKAAAQAAAAKTAANAHTQTRTS